MVESKTPTGPVRYESGALHCPHCGKGLVKLPPRRGVVEAWLCTECSEVWAAILRPVDHITLNVHRTKKWEEE